MIMHIKAGMYSIQGNEGILTDIAHVSRGIVHIPYMSSCMTKMRSVSDTPIRFVTQSAMPRYSHPTNEMRLNSSFFFFLSSFFLKRQLKFFLFSIDTSTMKYRLRIIVAVFCFYCNTAAQNPPEGFQNALWSMSAVQVQNAARITNWQTVTGESGFPDEINIQMYQSPSTIAGYSALVTYYFYDDKFFQATIAFNFDHLKNFDFNYNVFISVDKYYRAIRDQTLTFVTDIYDLLRKKYGRKQPVFKGLDPRFVFVQTDRMVKQNIWNFRYHPYEYYKKIVSAAYARWDFPQTKVIFSVNISAVDKRFDYQLSLTSLDLEKEIQTAIDSVRYSDL